MPSISARSIFKCLVAAALVANLGLGGCSHGKPKHQVEIFDESSGQITRRERLRSVVNGDEKIVEFFWTRPQNQGTGPWPVMIMIHGDQFPQHPGGRDFVRNGSLKTWADRGFVTIAVSQPGYGSTDGPADLCGELSVNSIETAWNWAKDQDFVATAKGPKPLVIYGIGRGASLAAIMATRIPEMKAGILISGFYDWNKVIGRLKGSSNELLYAEAERFESEVDSKNLVTNSPISHAASIKMPLLLLNGAKDDRAQATEAEEFAKAVLGAGGMAITKVSPEDGYFQASGWRNPKIIEFLNALGLISPQSAAK